MSLFPPSFIRDDPAASFGPLFRLLDDFDQHRGNVDSGRHHYRSGPKMFTPRFDVRELPDHYELNGELPGIEQRNVEIGFIDAQTLTVHGRTEHSYTSGTPPAGFVEGPTSSGTITEGGEGHKATVEDDEEPPKTPRKLPRGRMSPQSPKPNTGSRSVALVSSRDLSASQLVSIKIMFVPP
jgi:HSP20 family protein